MGINMSKDNNIRMPSSGSGLVSYSSDYKSKVSFKPGFVIVMCAIVVFIVIMLNILH